MKRTKEIKEKQPEDIFKSIILDYLTRMQNQWCPLKQIQRVCAIDDVSLRIFIKDLRASGHWIIASVNGYKLTTDKKEMELYIRKRSHEIAAERDILDKMLMSLARNGSKKHG